MCWGRGVGVGSLGSGTRDVWVTRDPWGSTGGPPCPVAASVSTLAGGGRVEVRPSYLTDEGLGSYSPRRRPVLVLAAWSSVDVYSDDSFAGRAWTSSGNDYPLPPPLNESR